MAGARIQLKRATASSWSSANPVLYAGEIGYETDTNKFKIGNGSTAYNSLPYFNGNLTGSSLNDLADVTIVSASNGDFLRWNGTAWINDAVNLSTDTVGNYMVDVVSGTGVTVTHTPGEGSTASVAIGQDVATTASVTFAHVNADVTGDVLGDLTGNADTATTLETARTIELSGDVTGSVSFDGSGDVNIVASVASDAVELGVNTTGNYMTDVVGGTGVTITHTPGEGSSASIAIGQAVATSSSVTFAAVTAPLIGNANTASALQTARVIQLIGDLSGSASFDGSTNIQISASVEPNSVALGQDTTGDYMQDIVGGTGVTVVHTPGESSTASVSIGQDVSTSASVTFANLTVSGDLTVNGTTTTLNTQDLLVEDNTIVLNANVTGDPSGTAGIEIERGSLTNVQLRWNETTDSWEITEDGTTYRNIAAGQDVETSSSVTFAAVTAPLIGNASTATTLATARAISLGGDLSGSVSFDGSQDVTITADVQPNSVALGTDTTGNYVNDIVSGTGVTVTHTPGEGSSASIAIGQDVATTASVTFAAVTAPVIGNANTATTLQTARAISLAGDLSGSASFNGSTDITITADVQPNSVALGTDTTGNYVNDITAGTGVTVSHTPGEGSSPTVSIGQAVGTSSSVTFAHVSADVTGALTGNASTATTLQTSRAISLAGDLSGSVSFNGGSDVTITAQVQPNSVALGTDTTGNYVNNVVSGTGVTVTHTPGEGSSASIAIGQDVATTASVTFAAVTAPLVGNASTATALQTARTIELSGDVSGSASFDGTSNINISTTVNTASVSITELGGVNITNPEEFQTLEYNGTQWVNQYASVVSYVQNAEATTLTTGTVVYLFGGTGDHASVKRADNNADSTSSKTVGLVGANIAASQNGPVITRGYVDGIDLSVGYAPGDVLWLGENGAFTKTKPSAPDHLVFVGVVVRATNNGIVYVATQNGYELEELHDVKVTGLADGDFLKYNSASGVWVNDPINLGTDTVGSYVQNLVAGTGVTLTNNSGEGSTPTVAIGQDVATSASVVFHTIESTHDLTIGGNLYVSGSVVTENQTSLAIDDPFIYLNVSSSVSNVDLGIAGNYNDGTYRHAGIFRDATDGKFKFFDSYEPEPSSPIDVAHATYSPAPVVAETFESTVTTGTAPFAVSSTTEVANLHADTATTLHTARAISLGGDLSGSASFDGSGDITITASVEPNSVALGTDTTGNYMVGLAEGTGVTIIHTPGEGSTASVSIGQSVATTASVTFAHVSAPLSGNVVGNVTGDVSGNAGTATTLQNARTISLGGDLSGSASFNGGSDITITAAVQPNSVALGTDTTGNYMSDLTQGTGVTITHTPGEGSNATIAIGQAVGTSSSVTFAAVTAPLVGNASTATTLQNARAISLGGNLSGSASFDGSTDITITAAVQPNSVALGTDTTGNYVSDVTAGTGVTVTHTPGEGSSPTIAIGQAVDTSASVQFAQITTTGNVTIGGDLTVNGTTTTVNTETINLADNIIVLNSNETSAPSQNAGIEVERGSATNVALRWNEANDKWELTTDGTNYDNIATEDYAAALTPNSLDEIGDVTLTSASAGDFLKWNGSAWVNDPINLGTDTVGNYVSDVVAGNLITVTHTPGEGSSASVAVTNGTAGQIIVANASGVPTWVTESGDITIDSSGVTAISSGVIVNADISNSAAIAHSKLANASAGQVLLGTTTTGVVTATTVSGDVTITGAGVTAIGAGVIVDADINAAAAISHSKLANITAGSILMGNASNVPTATSVSGDVTITSGGVTAIGSGVIVNADINSSAAIALSKLASGTSAQVIVANSSGVPTYTTLSGDVTISNTGVVSIAANSVALGTDTTGNYVANVSGGTGITVTHTPGEGSSASVALNATLDDLSNVTVPSPSNGQVLTYSTASSAWIAQDGAAAINALDDIGNVTAPTPSAGDFLKWNGSAWVNDAIDLGTDTVGNYMSGVTAGTGVTVTHTPGEGSNATIAIGQAVATSSSVTFAAVTAPLVGNASTATTLQNARTINLGGDLSGSASFNGSTDITITAAVQPNSVALGTDTTGNYMVNVSAGDGITVTHTQSEGSTATISARDTLIRFYMEVI